MMSRSAMAASCQSVFAVAVAVAGDDDGRVRQRVGGVHRRAGGPVGPLAAGQLGLDEAVALGGLPPEPPVLPGGGSGGLVVAGVGLDGAGQFVGGDDGVGAAGGRGLDGGVGGDLHQGVAALGLVQLDPGGEQGGAGLVAADAQQGEAGDLQGADAQCRGVGEGGDPPGGPPAVDGDLDGDPGAAVEAEGVGGAVGAGAVGDAGGAGGAVDEDLGDRGVLAVQDGAGAAVGVGDDAREGGVDADLQCAGPEHRLAGARCGRGGVRAEREGTGGPGERGGGDDRSAAGPARGACLFVHARCPPSCLHCLSADSVLRVRCVRLWTKEGQVLDRCGARGRVAAGAAR